MQDKSQDYYDDEEFEGKSKTQVKKEMLALTELGHDIANLKEHELAQLPLSEELQAAFNEAKNITQNGARKRHFQFIGKLLRKSDSEVIVDAYEKLQDSYRNAARQLHAIENWRDQLLTGDNSVFESFVEIYPNADRQQTRALIRQAQKETSQKKPPASARKLFILIRETINQAAADE